MLAQILTIAAFLALTLPFAFIKKENALTKALKILALTYFAIGFLRGILADSFIAVHVKIDDVSYPADVWQTILRWGHNASYVVFVMAVFFDSRVFKKIALYYCLPFAMLSLAFFGNFMRYFTEEITFWVLVLPEAARAAVFGLELCIAMAIPLLILLKDRSVWRFEKGEWKRFAAVLPCVAISSVPVYALQSLFGTTDVMVTMFSSGQLVWIFAMAALIVTLCLVFRNKDEKTKFMLCMYLALTLFLFHNFQYVMGVKFRRLPFQLCNIASYFYVIMLLNRKQSFFDFCFLANIIGSLIAIAVSDTTVGVLAFWSFHYIMEHTFVISIPILCVALGVFKLPNKKAMLHFMVGYTAYFLFCFVAGTIINGYADVGNYSKVNYFYMFNLDFAKEYAPFIGDFTVRLGRFALYPVMQSVIYVGFAALCAVLHYSIRLVVRLKSLLKPQTAKAQ